MNQPIALYTCILAYLYTCVFQNEPIFPIFQSKINVTKICIPAFLHTCIPVSSKRTQFGQARGLAPTPNSEHRTPNFLQNEPIFAGGWKLAAGSYFYKTNPFGIEHWRPIYFSILNFQLSIPPHRGDKTNPFYWIFSSKTGFAKNVYLYSCILAYLLSQNEPIWHRILETYLFVNSQFSIVNSAAPRRQNEPIFPIFQSKIDPRQSSMHKTDLATMRVDLSPKML
jgi:hypothetical protein